VLASYLNDSSALSARLMISAASLKFPFFVFEIINRWHLARLFKYAQSDSLYLDSNCSNKRAIGSATVSSGMVNVALSIPTSLKKNSCRPRMEILMTSEKINKQSEHPQLRNMDGHS